MALALNVGKCTLLGNYRENNEDSIDVKQFPDLIVGIVADGMGGQAAGEIASKRTIEIIPRELRKNLSLRTSIPDGVKTVMRRSIVQANEEIMAMGALDKDMKNMGTTVVMAIWRKGSEMFVTGVGDSRVLPRSAMGANRAADDRSLFGPSACRSENDLGCRSQGASLQERSLEIRRQQGSRRRA